MHSDKPPTDHPIPLAATGLLGSGQIAILLATYNGQRFLSQQLDSIAQQTRTNWQVYVADDGSQDDTRLLLQRYQKTWGPERISIGQGPRRGFAANFLSLIHELTIQADFYAYADQDDIWHANKLSRAMLWLSTIALTQPALYCSRTQLVDVQGQPIGLSPLFSRPPSFANALVQSIAGGNTMVFNQAARCLLCQVDSAVAVLTHDWWTYLLVSGCSGAVFYDKTPSLDYRQHNHNLVGSNRAWSAKISRASQLLGGQFRRFNERNIQALQSMQSYLSQKNHLLFEQFCVARSCRGWLSRLLALWRCRVYRQTYLDNIGLLVAAVLNKL